MRFWKPVKIKPELVTVIAVAYFNNDPRRFAAFQCLAAAFLAQTYPEWQLVVYHDGPVTADGILDHPIWKQDSRLVLKQTPKRTEKFGHPNRALGIKEAEGTVLCMTNDDNYFVPVYLEWLLGAMQQQQVDMVYCNAIHSHLNWQMLDVRLRPGKVDVGGWLVKTSKAQQVPWDDFSFRGDGIYVSRLAKICRCHKVRACLFVHN